jgi:hypothetical protein
VWKFTITAHAEQFVMMAVLSANSLVFKIPSLFTNLITLDYCCRQHRISDVRTVIPLPFEVKQTISQVD